MNLGLHGKVAIITGGSQGIGKAAATRLVAEGAKVAIVARRLNMLEDAARDIRGGGQGAVLPVAADVSKPQDCARIVDTVVKAFGKIDILVNNAGTSSSKPFEDVTDEEWEVDFAVKVWGAIRLTRLVIPHMRAQGGGRIINLVNIGAKAPTAAAVPTSVSRAAGLALTKALSRDLAKDNILVNAVCIGAVKSGQHHRRYEQARERQPNLSLDEFYSQMAKQRAIPLGRVGESAEAGDVIAFLASARASYLTGVALNIDGGTSPVT